MGLFDGLKAIKEVKKIKKGNKGNLSIAQITNLIINLPDAKAKLSSEEFNQIYSLFNELQKCNTKMELNQEGYYSTTVDIITKFDKIAPYEKYSGGNELEYSFMMDEIHRSEEKNTEKVKEVIEDNIIPEELEYANTIADSSNGIATRTDAKKFITVLHTYSINGKEQAISEFEKISQYLIENNGAIKALSQISYFLGVMNANQIITQDEMKELSKNYQDIIMKLLSNKS